MDLETLARRLDHERGTERQDEEVVVMAPNGRRLEVLSLNWDERRGQWIIVTDHLS